MGEVKDMQPTEVVQESVQGSQGLVVEEKALPVEDEQPKEEKIVSEEIKPQVEEV